MIEFDEETQKRIDFLKENGFKCYAPVNRLAGQKSYCFYYEYKSMIGYFEKNSFGHTKVVTVHKPNQYPGTGFAAAEDIGIEDIAKYKRGFCIAPNWAGSKERESVVKYKNFEEFQEQNKILTYEEV